MAEINDGAGTTLVGGTTPYTIRNIELTPPGQEADEIDLTSLANSAVKTKTLSTFRNVTECTGRGFADPSLSPPYGVAQAWVLTHPDTSFITFYGKLRSVTPTGITFGAAAEVDFAITTTNLNGASETAPAYSAAPE